ncbi:MAG: carboxypeptidase regulatory-like domain-containing protein [Terriglobales bacterium]
MQPFIRRNLLSFFRVAGLAFFAILLAALPALAQLDTGSISGVVTDPTGSAVKDVTITAKETSTGTTYKTISSGTGYYVFPSVRTGTYELRAEPSAGFKTAVYSGVVVTVASHIGRDIALVVGTVSETVAVTADVLTLETESSEVDASITKDQVYDLPLAVTGALRSISSLEFLVPGAVGPGTSVGGAAGLQMSKIAGGQTEGTDYLVDGITTNRMQNGSGSFDIVSPSVESIQEFHVDISGMSAEFGRTTGGLANYKTRSGTNQYHGAVFDYFKNAALDGNNWFNNGYAALNPSESSLLKRPADTKNNYGISMGGPIRIPGVYDGHDKTFFLFSYEQLFYHTGGSPTANIPTPAELGSDGQYFDFSSTLGGPILDSNGNQVYGGCSNNPVPLNYGEIFDPQYEANNCNSTPFPNNKIPIGRESQVAQAVLKYMPAPNLSGGTNNYVYKTSDNIAQTVLSVRIDQNLGQKHKIWGFYSTRENNDHGLNPNLPAPLTSAGGGWVDQRGKMSRAGWDWFLTPTLVNSLTFGTNRSNNYNKSAAARMGTEWDSTLGIANGSGPVFPGFVFNGSPYPNFGENDDAQDVDNTIALNDIIHWQHGAHSLSFGGEVQYHQFSFISKIGGTCSGTSGCFTFWDNQTASDTTNWGSDGNSFAAFLIGQAGTANALKQLHAPRWIAHTTALFVQDNWKLKPNLTLNLGLRWSFDTPRHEAEGDTTNFSPTTPNPGADGYLGALVFGGKGTGRNGNVGETWATTYYKDFEPRVGFAYSPSSLHNQVVFRGSAGIYYGPLVYADYGQGTLQGFTANQTLFTGDPLSGPQVDAGLPALSTTPDLDPAQSNGQGVDYVAKSNGRPAMVESWNLETQVQVRPNLYFSLGYIGNHATRLHGLLQYPNDIPLSALSMGTCLEWWAVAPCPNGWSSPPIQPYPGFSCASGCTYGISEWVEQALRPFPQVGYVNMDSYLQNVGQSSYDAMEVKLERRFHNGLNVLVSYTFSKTETDADSIQPYYSTLQSQGGTQNPYDLKAEKAVSNQDIPNNFVASYIYELPIGRGKRFLAGAPAPVNAIIGGWRVSGVNRYLSGQPISFFGARGIPGFDNGIRPNRVAGQLPRRQGAFNPLLFNNDGNTGYDHGSGACTTGYWNCSAFADPNPNPGIDVPFVFGNMPRNSGDIRSFPFYDEDIGIAKTFSITERVKAEFRGELFNAFNRHVFNKPDSGVQDTNFGQVGSTLLGPRNGQFVLRFTF